jgi:hypothetical protein
MRIATFPLAASLLTAVLFAQIYLPPKSQLTQHEISRVVQRVPPGSDGERMWTRAQIRVIPLETAISNRTELESLRNHIAKSEVEALRLSSSNPSLREPLFRQLDLMKALLHFAESQDSDQGKSAVAIDVQRHLNEIEGRINCEACHTEVVATSAPGRNKP